MPALPPQKAGVAPPAPVVVVVVVVEPPAPVVVVVVVVPPVPVVPEACSASVTSVPQAGARKANEVKSRKEARDMGISPRRPGAGLP